MEQARAEKLGGGGGLTDLSGYQTDSSLDLPSSSRRRYK